MGGNTRWPAAVSLVVVPELNRDAGSHEVHRVADPAGRRPARDERERRAKQRRGSEMEAPLAA